MINLHDLENNLYIRYVHVSVRSGFFLDENLEKRTVGHCVITLLFFDNR